MFDNFNLKSMFGIRKKANDPGVKLLLTWKKGDENGKWAEKALKLLVKRLGKTTDGLTKLEAALASADELSACVPLATSIDGRIQLSYRKVLPHVVFCRLWRWPDLLSHHELNSVEASVCQFPYEKKAKAVCINPYHYRRKVMEEKTMFEDGFGTLAMPPNVTVCSVQESPMVKCYLYPVAEYSPYSDPPMIADNSPGSGNNGGGSSFETNSEAVSPAGGDSGQSAAGIGDGGGGNENSLENSLAPAEDADEVPAEQLSFWCKISYYELSNRIGPIFSVTSNPVTIDGFTNPHNDPQRISLGSLSNINRNSTINQTRLNIAEGIRLHYHRPAGHLFVEVLFEHSIFVQSELLNQMNGQPSSMVTKINADSGLVKIFDDEQFAEVLLGHYRSDYLTVYSLTSMCTIRLSFIKGWGGAPYYRSDAVQTPCWMEVQMRQAMMRLDEVLVRMIGPDDRTDSH